MDEESGAGYSSKENFGSGLFEIMMKIPDNKDIREVISTFYLIDIPYGEPVYGRDHFEFDIEFFGSNLSTNVFANDLGNREQRFKLWFDPAADYHKYQILWNQHHIVWFIDGEPIRIWKNATDLGVPFPNKLHLHVEASIWHGDFSGQPDWSLAPFIASYKGFAMNACVFQESNPEECYSETSYFWNGKQYWQLDASQQAQLNTHREKHMVSDYCSDDSKSGPECEVNK
ncbi:OLC1v1019512C2 [Oldenlandia corymbosa var. corymbosa]|nr:OLC1v1019512C2 [Oldenlandia corymbosa var. corymbosa]